MHKALCMTSCRGSSRVIMMNKLKEHSGLIKLVLMIILSCTTQVVSLMKSSIVAGTFGTSAEMDAFNFANSVVSFLFSFVIAGVSTVVIPCYVKQMNKKSTNSFITIIFLGMLVIATLTLLFRIPIISIITRRNETFIELSGNAMIVLLISNLFSMITSVTSAYFQYAEKYNIPKIITLISQIVVVAVLGYYRKITILQYAFVIGAGVVLNSCIDLIYAIKSGWRYKPNFVFNEETKRLFGIFIPVLFSTGVYQLSLMIDSAIASRLSTGDITILNYANQISSMINTLLVSNLLIYFYPKLVKDIEDNKGQRNFWEKTYFFHAIMCLVIAGYAVVGHEGVSVLFEHGKFNAEAASAVFLLSFIYVSAQQVNVVRDLIYRYFYSYGDTKSTTVNSILATIVNITLSIILVRIIGLSGIIMGTAISSVVSLVMIMIRFKKSYGYSEKIKTIIMQYCKSILIASASAVVVWLTKNILAIDNKIFAILLYGMEVVVIYLLLTVIFNRKIISIAKQIYRLSEL